MYKKEFLDTLRVFVQSLLVLCLLPIALVLDWYVFHAQWELSGVLQPIYLGLVVVFAAYSGTSIFEVEKRDHALEYLLSLPVPVWQIIAAKILPRFLFLVGLILMGGLLGVWEAFVADALGLILVFLLAVSISLAVESTINAMIGVLLLNVILYYSSLIFSYLTMSLHLFGSETPIFLISYVLPLLLLLMPLLVAFWRTVKKLDAKPLKWQGQYYLRIALPAIGLLMVFILVFLKQYLGWLKP